MGGYIVYMGVCIYMECGGGGHIYIIYYKYLCVCGGGGVVEHVLWVWVGVY